MRLAELYPYWPHGHDEFLDRLALLPSEQVDFKPYGGVSSIRQMALHWLHFEREWVARLVAGFDIEPPRARNYPDGHALAEALAAQRDVTAQALEPLTEAGLRAVRTVPADPTVSRPEANRTIHWIVWYLLERELILWGQVQQRLEEYAAHAEAYG